MEIKKITFLFVAVTIFLGLGYFVYRDFNKESDYVLNTSSIFQGNDVKVEISPTEKPKISMPMPDLNRPVAWGETGQTPEVRVKTESKIKEIIARLKINSSVGEDWNELGLYQKEAGDYEGAMKSWEYASALLPLNVVPISNIGNLYQYYIKDNVLAEKYFMKVLSVNPSYMPGYLNLFELYTLSYREKLGQVPEIINEGLVKNPNNYDLFILMAYYYREIGDKANQLLYYEKALTVAPEVRKEALQEEINKLKN